MRRYLILMNLAAALNLLLDIAGTPAVRAQEPRSAEVLKRRGLTRQRGSGATWILMSEATVLDRYRAAKGFETRLSGAQRQELAIETGEQDPEALIESYRAEIRQYQQQVEAIDRGLANLGPPVGVAGADFSRNMLQQQQNAIIREQRRLGTLIRDLHSQREIVRDQQRQLRSDVLRLQQAFVDEIDDLRRSVPKILKTYASLAEDKAVQQALVDLSASPKIQQKLGPSQNFQKAAQWLERIESGLQSDTIQLQREGDADRIDAMINGKGPVRMVFDTGAGPTIIPARLAAELNLKPTGRTISCELADGSNVQAKVMIIPSITVGKLTIKDVVCAVMLKEKGTVPPLLGQSFLRHFHYRYSQGSGRLFLTRVEAAQSGTAAGPPAAGRRAESGRPSAPSGKVKGSRRSGGR
jgi:clan AA aspartic protease (TIGR02281 family)